MINSAAFTSSLTAGQQLASTVTADNSRNPTLAYDGLLTVGFNPTNGAYVQSLASGTAGIGTFLTASGRGSVNEIDNMLVHDVEQLSALADGSLRQRAGTEEHHQQVPDQRLRPAGPLQRRGGPERRRTLRHFGVRRGAVVL